VSTTRSSWSETTLARTSTSSFRPTVPAHSTRHASAKIAKPTGAVPSWLIADEAAQELAEIVDVYFPAKTLIKAAAGRLKKKGG
jgi:hypothetical protein